LTGTDLNLLSMITSCFACHCEESVLLDEAISSFG
jgi:hypothetical protein